MLPAEIEFQELIRQIKSCRICEQSLRLGPNPVLSAQLNSKIAIIGQAPGIKVHNTGIPWNDPSGNELRRWLNVDSDTFYDANIFAITPMGFCYPGKGKSGDLPPRPECSQTWHSKLFHHLQRVELIILIGQYAQKYYLKDRMKSNLTDTVNSFQSYLPKYFPLPHPSPRNRIWQKKNPWFEIDVIPKLQKRVNQIILEG